METFWAAVVGIILVLVFAYNFPFLFILIASLIGLGIYYFNFELPRQKHRDVFDAEYKRRKALHDEAMKISYPVTAVYEAEPWVPEWFVTEFNKLLNSLYADEFLKAIPPPVPPVYEEKFYQQMPTDWQRDVARRTHLNNTDGLNRFFSTTTNVADGILATIPPKTPSALRTTLLFLNPMPVNNWANILDAFWENDFAVQFRDSFHRNRVEYSKAVLSEKDLKDGKTLNPYQHEGSQPQALYDFYKNTPFNGIFNHILTDDYPFVIRPAARFSGTWIVAPPGRGKTNLLHNMISFDRKEQATVVLMDSKGDLINSYKGYPDVVVIDPATANINPLQLGSSTRSVEFLEYIFSALLETSMTSLQKTLFRAILTVLLKVPNATLETFRQVLTGGWRPLGLEPYIRQCDPSTQDFFLVGNPKPQFDSNTYVETKQQVLWRLQLLLSNEYLRAIFTSPTTNVPFSELLDSGKTIIIDNSKDDLGEDGAEFFGRFFVALTWMAAVSRSRLRPEQKMPVYFYIDECQGVIYRDTKIKTILDECRSQKIALILAHQRVGQINPDVMDALNNCAIRLANSDGDAEALAKRFRVEAVQLRLPIGSFACFVRDQTAQACTVSVPEFDMSSFPPTRQKAPPPPLKEPFKPRLVPKNDLDFG